MGSGFLTFPGWKLRAVALHIRFAKVSPTGPLNGMSETPSWDPPIISKIIQNEYYPLH